MHSSQNEVHPAALSTEKLLASCAIQRTRHTGPGGQHRNKVETAIRITHEPTGIVAFAGESRQQETNRRKAIERLRTLLAVQFRCVRSRVVAPSAMWERRCRARKLSCSESHVDFPSMLAEALDAISASAFDVRAAASALGCSSTQLVRFIGRVPEALETVNRSRESQGLHRLRA
jgi:RF-1 domain